MQVRWISDSTQHTLVLSPYIIFTCKHEESIIFNEFLNIMTLLGAFFSSCHISHLMKKSGWRQTPIKSWSQTSAHISDQNSRWLEPYEFHCGEVCVALGKVENSGDVTPSEAPHPLPVSTVTFHEDIFSSVVFANTDKAAAAEYYTFFYYYFPHECICNVCYSINKPSWWGHSSKWNLNRLVKKLLMKCYEKKQSCATKFTLEWIWRIAPDICF